MLIDKVDHLIFLQIILGEEVGKQEHTEGSNISLMPGVIIFCLSADRRSLRKKNEIVEITEYENVSG